MHRRLIRIIVVLAAAAAGSGWVVATEHAGHVPAVVPSPRPEPKWPLDGPAARALRDDSLRRAHVRTAPARLPRVDLAVQEPPLRCRFLSELPSGTSPKFDCMLPDGEVIKVKYGRNPEVAAEVAATRLVSALGLPADRMSVVPRVRCDGCPRYPFFAMHLLQLTRLHDRYPLHGSDHGYSDFEWVAVERKYPAAAIELPESKGWAWWELSVVDPAEGASRADLDALRLLAVFLAHWDNKSENQRLVCLDAPSARNQRCGRPLAMLQDLGATFGPTKMNLARWTDLRIWADRATCSVSMEHLPWNGGTFPSTRIGEAGRVQLARQLAAIGDEDIRALFRAARFPEYYSATSDAKDLEAWTAAFRRRADQITSGDPCPQ